MANEQRMRPRKRKKVCAFCVDKVTSIDYKDTAKIRRYLSERGKILPRRTTGTCAAHQRDLTTAIKRARQIALGKPQEYFVYFKVFPEMSCGKRTADVPTVHF